MSPVTTNVGPVLESAIALLTAAGVPSPDVDARILLSEVVGLKPQQLAASFPLSSAQVETYRGLIARRAKREPLQHIIGKAWFRHLELVVGPGVFIPRPETEVLVDLALAEVQAIQSHGIPTVVDLCTGSGAIILALATESRVNAIGVEVDAAAYSWAERNATLLATDIATAGSTLKLTNRDARLATDDEPELADSVDIVTCNPPYIPDAAIPRDPEVRDYDPRVALYGGADGLDVVRDIVDEVGRMLKPGGLILIEHGDEQGEGVTRGVPGVLNASASFESVRDHLDLAGRPRVTTARRRPER